MSITANTEKKALILQTNEGLINGKAVFSRKRYSVLPNATDDKIYEVGQAIKGLTTKEIVGTLVETTDDLVQI